MANWGGFSWRRFTGVSGAKAKISRQTGIPLSQSGRQQKLGRLIGGGCLLSMLVFVAIFTWIVSGCSESDFGEPAVVTTTAQDSTRFDATERQLVAKAQYFLADKLPDSAANALSEVLYSIRRRCAESAQRQFPTLTRAGAKTELLRSLALNSFGSDFLTTNLPLISKVVSFDSVTAIRTGFEDSRAIALQLLDIIEYKSESEFSSFMNWDKPRDESSGAE